MFRFSILAVAGLGLLSLVAAFFIPGLWSIIPSAWAQATTSPPPNPDAVYAVGWLCQHQDLAITTLSFIFGARIISAFRETVVTKMPPWMQHVLNFVAINWRRIAEDTAMVAKVCVVLGFGLLVTACANTPGKPSPLPIPLPSAQDMFKQACADISTAHGSFVAVSPALLLSGSLTQADMGKETAIFNVASDRCDHPPTLADGTINYQQLALDTAGDAAAIYILFAGK